MKAAFDIDVLNAVFLLHGSLVGHNEIFVNYSFLLYFLTEI